MKSWVLGLLIFWQISTSYAAETPSVATSAATPPASASLGAPATAEAAASAAPTAKLASPSLLDQGFIDKYPHLKQNIYTEPPSNLYLGFSLGVLGILKDREFFSANFFQVHYLTSSLDYEVLSISYGTTIANPSYLQATHFVFRSVPKYRLSKLFSIGPVLGYEYVSFAKINAVLYNSQNSLQTKTEPFSSSGLIYGLGASENFDWDKSYKIKINQLIYQETYSTEKAGRGWSYLYELQNLRTDVTPIKAGILILVEVGVLF